MERSGAALAVSLTATGHRAVIITADRRAPTSYEGAPVVVLNTLAIPDPCGDPALRAAIDAADERLPNELLTIYAAHRVDAADNSPVHLTVRGAETRRPHGASQERGLNWPGALGPGQS